MKVLHIIPSLAAACGGPPEAVLQLCRELKYEGIESAIATTKMDAHNIEDKNRPVPIYSFARQFNLFFPKQFAYSYGFKKWLKNHIQEFDLLHIHYLFSFPCTIAAHYAKKYRIPYIIRPAGMLDPVCLRKSAFKKKIYMLLFEKGNLGSAAALHFTSEKEREAAKKLKLNNKNIVVPNGIDLKGFAGLDAFKGGFRKYHPRANARKIILFLSRIDPIKGLDLVIPALKMISKKRGDFIFVLAGAGARPYERRVIRDLTKNGLSELTILAGFVEAKEKLALLADADIFILPSYHESFGMAIVEAMAAAVPVVVSEKVNIYGLIKDCRAGIITKLDSEDISSALDILLTDVDLRTQMGNNGKKLVQDNFDVRKIARQMAEIYFRLKQ